MKPIGPTVRKYLKDQQMKVADIAENMGMSPSQLSTLLSKNSWDAEKLEKMCIATGLSPMTFFEIGGEGKVVVYSDIRDVMSSSNIGNTSVTMSAGTAERIIEEKNRLIEEKERTIQILLAASGLKPGTDPSQN